MFQFLHKAVVAAMILAVVAVVALIVHQRHRFEPVLDWAHILRHREPAPDGERQRLGGEVARVLDGHSILLRDVQGRRYFVRLTGVTSPPLSEREQARESRQALSNLVLSNRVDVELTYLNEHGSGLGFVFVNGTNVNTTLAGQGHVKVQRQFIRQLHAREQYALLRAERQARASEARLAESPMVAASSANKAAPQPK